MRLISLEIHRATSCGGLLDETIVSFARSDANNHVLVPLCLLGPNGSGKSQLLQFIAELFQTAWHVHAAEVERDPTTVESHFELHYSLSSPALMPPVRVRLRRSAETKPAGSIEMAVLNSDGWEAVPATSQRYGELLPSLIVGYTSGDNETLSLPFLISRSGYARDVGEAALKKGVVPRTVRDNRLLLIDYGTHLEVLVANLLLGQSEARASVLRHAGLDRLASCRCIVQLNHSAAPKGPRGAGRRGIQLTDELEAHIEYLRRSATCWNYDEKNEIYIFDYFIDAATLEAFGHFFASAIDLYRAFHKLALLNDLAIPKRTRERLRRETRDRRFASRLPEPQDEDKVFRFEQVRLRRVGAGPEDIPVDYVSLSDGEHQQAEILGVFAMITDENALFLLDEPESHFNPQWRVQFVKRVLELPTDDRRPQEVIMTSHSPFVPSDMPRQQVLIFSKEDGRVRVRHPEIETYGATFDRILEHCFNVHPPISQLARDEINTLMEEGTSEEIKSAMTRLGSSVEKAFLSDRLRELSKNEKT